MVLRIFVDFTMPVRIRPRIETSPVNGHFLSMYVPLIASVGVLNPRPTSLYHRLPFVVFETLAFWKMWGCFWKDFSDCTAISDDMVC